VEVVPGDNMIRAFVNSLSVAVPSTVIPILIAAFAAYAFAWMEFPGRREMFIMVVALQVVPLQIALVPILRDYKALNLNGTFLGIWLSHTGFGLALATYLLYNYISSLPREILESAYIDGASHFTAFTQLVLPLSVPALASFAIFQFNWVWNDYLVALIFLGGNPEFSRGICVNGVALDCVLCAAAILLARLAGRLCKGLVHLPAEQSERRVRHRGISGGVDRRAHGTQSDMRAG
jgi:alpha-glucoside transport system permease protein